MPGEPMMSRTATRVAIPEGCSRWAAVASAWRIAGRWKAPIGFALLDQGITSGASFILLAIAARVLPVDEFGRYSIVWALSLLLMSGATALTVEPLAAILSSRGPSMRIPILAASAQLSLLLGGVVAVVILMCGLTAEAWSSSFAPLLLCLAATSPLQQLHLASRRFCYLLHRQGVAAASACVYATILVGGALTLWATDTCSGWGVVLLSGAASLAGLSVGIATSCVPALRVRRSLRRCILRQCWRTGKWLAGSSITLWLSSASIFPISAAIYGAAETGIIRAQSILLMPVHQFTWAMGYLLVPHMADIAARHPRRVGTMTLLSIGTLGTVAAAYSSIILLFSGDLLTLIYNKPEITAASSLLWPLAVGAIVNTIAAAMAIVLTAKGVTKPVFWARVASVAVFVPGAVILGSILRVDAIVWAMAAASAVCGLILASALMDTVRRSQSAWRSP
jgi:O-antigen/teichoic acid export membrane protein